MPTFLPQPTTIPVPGNKKIEEFVGHVNTRTSDVSIAHMHSPSGWTEPGQTPTFDEYTLVLKGWMRVEHTGGVMEVLPGQAVVAHKGEWVRYSTPGPDGAEYIAVCMPAFTPEGAHRNE